LGSKFPVQSRAFLPDLIARLDDENRVCRVLAGKALGQVAARKSGVIEECFQNLKKEIPPDVLRILRKS
jgi:hypothetical protein